jgi:heme/copper-type cytochrome/quinol oxidase subunit 1
MDKFDIAATRIIKEHLVSKLGRELTEIEISVFSLPRSGIAYEMMDDEITNKSKSVQDIERYVFEVVKEHEQIILASNNRSTNTSSNKNTPFSTISLTKNPHHVLVITSVLFFITSFFKRGDAFDINMHDTYYVIANVSLYRVFAGMLLCLWLIYQIISRLTLWSKKLTWLHVLFTILPMIFFAARLWRIFTLEGSLDGIPKRYYAFSEFQKKPSFVSIETICVLILAFLFLGQVLFLINIIGGAVKRLNTHRSS